MSLTLRKSQFFACTVLPILFPVLLQAQHPMSDSVLEVASLDKVVQYALTHQPAVQQAKIDEEITSKMIKGKLADWYPQINFTYNYQHFFETSDQYHWW